MADFPRNAAHRLEAEKTERSLMRQYKARGFLTILLLKADIAIAQTGIGAAMGLRLPAFAGLSVEKQNPRGFQSAGHVRWRAVRISICPGRKFIWDSCLKTIRLSDHQPRTTRTALCRWTAGHRLSIPGIENMRDMVMPSPKARQCRPGHIGLPLHGHRRKAAMWV